MELEKEYITLRVQHVHAVCELRLVVHQRHLGTRPNITFVAYNTVRCWTDTTRCAGFVVFGSGEAIETRLLNRLAVFELK